MPKIRGEVFFETSHRFEGSFLLHGRAIVAIDDVALKIDVSML